LAESKVQPPLAQVVAKGLELPEIGWWQGLWGPEPQMADRQRGDEDGSERSA